RFEHGTSAFIPTDFQEIHRTQFTQLGYHRTAIKSHRLQAAVLHPVRAAAPKGGQLDEAPLVQFIEKAPRSHVRQLTIGPHPLPMKTQLSRKPVTTPVRSLGYPLDDLLEQRPRPAASLDLQARFHRCPTQKHSAFSESSKKIYLFSSFRP